MFSRHYQLVKKFMQFALQATPSSPTIPSEKDRVLRAKLILEEAIETIEGLGIVVHITADDLCGEPLITLSHWANIATYRAGAIPFDLMKVIDGCCDTNVVITGTLIACGVPDLPFQEEVDANNLAKFGPGHTWGEDGKLIKPPGHKPPDLEGVMRRVIQSKYIKGNLPIYIQEDEVPDAILFTHPVHNRMMALIIEEGHLYQGYLMMLEKSATGSDRWCVTSKATQLQRDKIEAAVLGAGTGDIPKVAI